MSISSPLNMSKRLQVLLAIVAIISGIQYLLFPIIYWQHQNVAQAKQLQGAIVRKKMLTGSTKEMNDIYLENIKLRDSLRVRFPAGSSAPQSLQLALQKQIEKWAKDLDIQVKNIDWLPIGKETVIRAPIRFHLQAMPDKFMKLLFSLETAPHLYTIEGIRITAPGGRSPALNAELEVCAYGISEEPRS